MEVRKKVSEEGRIRKEEEMRVSERVRERKRKRKRERKRKARGKIKKEGRRPASPPLCIGLKSTYFDTASMSGATSL